MGDISNKSLAALLVVAMVVSVAGTSLIMIRNLGLFSVTGKQISQSGLAQVEVTTNASFIFSVSSLQWGTGYVNTPGGFYNCTLNTNGTTTGCAGFNTLTTPLQLQNDGNRLLSVDLNFSKTSGEFLSSPLSTAQFRVSEVNDSCIGALSNTTWSDFDTANPTICANLQPLNGNDTLNIDFNLFIDYNETASNKNVTVTALGTTI